MTEPAVDTIAGPRTALEVTDEALRTISEALRDTDPGASVELPLGLEATALASGQGMRPAAALPRIALSPMDGEAVDLEIGETLGEGGMGRVLLARQRSLRREVALKVLRDASRAGDVAALVSEAMITGAIAHPNVVPIHALGIDGRGDPVLVMKRIDGVSLQALLARRDHPAWAAFADDGVDRLEAALEILMTVCNAAHFAHSVGVVHRDIKLENIMVGSFGEVYLVDWGIALRRAAGAAGEAGPTAVAGTPSYMAPELLSGSAECIDARTDVYLLGATLHAILTGRPRHRGKTIHEVLTAVRASRPFRYGPEVPTELAAICNQATAAAPAERFRSALELRRALGAFLRHKGSIALSDEASARLAAVADAAAERRHTLLTEARFGFMSALREWPESAAARAGLEACLRRMIDHELARRDLEGARALHSELAAPDPEILARIATLAAELADAVAREERLRSLERERDLRIGGQAQLVVVGVLPVVAITLGCAMIARDFAAPSAAVVVALPAMVCAALVAGRVLLRPRLQTEVSRTALAVLAVLPGAAAVHRLLAFRTGASLPAVLLGDLVIAASVGGALALTVLPRLVPAVVVWLAAATGIAIWPQGALPIFGSGTVSGMILLAITWRRAVRA